MKADMPPMDISTLMLAPEHLALVRAILQRVVPMCEVRAFGSRVKGTAKPYSDLDLCLRSSAAVPLAIKAELAEAFSESDLPWRVDIVDWFALSDAFRARVMAQSVILQNGAADSTHVRDSSSS